MLSHLSVCLTSLNLISLAEFHMAWAKNILVHVVITGLKYGNRKRVNNPSANQASIKKQRVTF